jgi:3-deoxy-D-manno-octulosonic-acid transferase
LLRVADADAVFTGFGQLLQDPAACQARVACGRFVYQSLAGALQRTLDNVRALVVPFNPADNAPVHAGRHGTGTIWADSHRFADAAAALFDPDAWRQQGSAEKLGAGRGNIHTVADARGHFPLRHYYRGGLMARISRDLFLARPVAASRAIHQRSLSDAEWQALGQAVRRMHDAQCLHSDLNCHNLMLDAQGSAWIVDFDKCGFRPGDDWKAGNLDRLLRSPHEELRLNPGFHWDDTRWPIFLAAYAAGLPASTKP